MATSLSASHFPKSLRRNAGLLLAAALGWMLDAFDAMLYALVLAHVMRDLGMTQRHRGPAQQPDPAGVRNRRRRLRIHRRSPGPQARPDAEHPHLLDLFVRVRPFDFGPDAGRLPFHPWAWAWEESGIPEPPWWLKPGRPSCAPKPSRSCRVRGRSATRWPRWWPASCCTTPTGEWRSSSEFLPALVVLWIRRGVPESEMWQERHGQDDVRASSAASQDRDPETGFARIFRPPYAKHTLALLLMNFFGMFAWWGLFTWIPPYLSLPVEQGGRGFGVMGTTTLLVVLNLAGMFPGIRQLWLGSGLSGRRKSFILYTFDGSTYSSALCHGQSAMGR